MCKQITYIFKLFKLQALFIRLIYYTHEQ